MPVSSYPRVAVQGSTATGNPQNGLSLMLLNAISGEYEAATSATFAGGGGGGDATAANQATQIAEAQQTNVLLADGGFSAAQILNAIGTLLSTLNGNVSTAALQANQIAEAQQTNALLTDGGLSAAQILALVGSLLNTLNGNVSTAALQSTIIDTLKLINGGETGSYLITSDLGVVAGLSARKIVINEDCVINNLRDANNNNLLTLYNLTGKTLKQGSVLIPYDGTNIVQIGVASGSLIHYGA